MSYPTGHRVWTQEGEAHWRRLEVLLERSKVSLKRLAPDEIREMALLYRALTNDLARVRSTPELRHLEPYLNNLAQRSHGRVYERPPASGKDIFRFFSHDFPRCFRKNSLLIGLACLLFTLGTAIAIVTVRLDPATERFFLPIATIAELDRGVLWTDNTQANPSESSFLMTNNIRVAVNAFAMGIILGVGTLVLLFQNGLFAFGGPLEVCFNHGMGPRLLQFIIAHGTLELTTVFIAGGAGMLIGFSLLFPGPCTRWQALRMKSSEAFVLILGCFPMLMVAGLIEGLVSLNRHVSTPIRLTVAILTIFSMIGYLGYSGREPKLKTPFKTLKV